MSDETSGPAAGGVEARIGEAERTLAAAAEAAATAEKARAEAPAAGLDPASPADSATGASVGNCNEVLNNPCASEDATAFNKSENDGPGSGVGGGEGGVGSDTEPIIIVNSRTPARIASVHDWTTAPAEPKYTSPPRARAAMLSPRFS